MAIVEAVKNFTIYFADGHVGIFVATTSLGACIQARKYHSADIVYTTEGIGLKYHFNGYGWDNLEAAEERNQKMLDQCNRLVDAGVCTVEQFMKCCSLYIHLINASVISIDGQWYIIDAVCDPMDHPVDHDMQFLDTVAVHAHNYDDADQGGGDQIHIIWENLIDDLADGSTELLRMQPMKIS